MTMQTTIMNMSICAKHFNLIFLIIHRGKNNKDESKIKTDLKIYINI